MADITETFKDLFRETLREVLPEFLNQNSSIPEEKPNPKTGRLLTAVEVQQKFDIVRSTLIDWGKKGIISPAKFGGRVYYREDEINALFDQHRKVS